MSKKSPQTPLQLRGRIWIERGSGPALTDAGADLLEQIGACGSLSEAARRLRFSYRRSWLLVDTMNQRWPAPLLNTAVGGKNGGGTTLTDLGAAVLRAYRHAQLQVEHLLGQQESEFLQAIRSHTDAR